MTRTLRAAAAFGLLLPFTTGCQSTDAAKADKPQGQASVEKVWQDAPVGSKMKRRVPKNKAVVQDAGPTSRLEDDAPPVVTPALTTGEVERAVTGGP